MSRKKQIFYVFACDEWKSDESMRLEMVTTSVRRLRSFIAKMIEDECYEYGDTNLPPKKQAVQFREDFDAKTSWEINGLLKWAFYDYAYDGEEL